MPPPEIPKMSDEAQAMYTGICMCRNTEVNLRWARSQIFILINLGGFSFLGTQRATPEIYPLLAIFAGLLGAYWLWINQKTQHYIDHWQSCLAAIDPPPLLLNQPRVFTGSSWQSANKKPNFYHLLSILPVFFMVLWAGIGVTPIYETAIGWFLNLFKGGA